VAGFAGAGAFEGWARGLRAKEWVVYSKPPFGGPAAVLKYLARYTHRVAISNARLVRFDGARVAFRYKDYAGASKTKVMTLDAAEFLRRWAQHVLPGGFVRVRHYGLLANRHRAAKLAACRRRLVAAGVVRVSCAPAARPPDPCPACGCDRWVVLERLAPGDPACRAVARADSS
jgi:hypothetical protein